ncbi:MAG: hypothetical protein WBA59_00610 [Moheibacter sp.]
MNLKSKILTVFLLFFTVNLAAQESLKILESYILEDLQGERISKRALPAKDLKWILEMYFENTLIIPTEEETFELVKSNFTLDDKFPADIEFHDFSFKANKRKNISLRFTLPLISKNRKYAVFYQERPCKRNLCGSGILILMEKKDGKWIKKSILTGWIS